MKNKILFYASFALLFPTLCFCDWKEYLSQPGYYAVIGDKATYLNFIKLLESSQKNVKLSLFSEIPSLGKDDFLVEYGDIPNISLLEYDIDSKADSYFLKYENSLGLYNHFSMVSLGTYNGIRLIKLIPRKNIRPTLYIIKQSIMYSEYDKYTGFIIKSLDEGYIEGQSLDASNIVFINNKIISDNGGYLSWSSDGNKILYTHFTDQGPELWQVNSDGTQNKYLFRGSHGIWSPDGTRIAFIDKINNQYNLKIFDIKQNKLLYQDDKADFHINDSAVLLGDMAYDIDFIYWYRNKIYYVSSLATGYASPELRRVEILNIDSLEWSWSNENDQEIYLNIFRRNDKLAHLNIVSIPPFKMPNDKIKELSRYAVPNFIKGIWISNKDGSYFIRIMNNAAQPLVDPSLKRIAYVKMIENNNTRKWQLNIADIHVGPKKNRLYYEAEIGKSVGAQEGDILFISKPKINPLNNKIIGSEGPLKAIVVIRKVEENSSIIRPVVIVDKIEIGDVAAYEDQSRYGLIKKENDEYTDNSERSSIGTATAIKQVATETPIPRTEPTLLNETNKNAAILGKQDLSILLKEVLQKIEDSRKHAEYIHHAMQLISIATEKKYDVEDSIKQGIDNCYTLISDARNIYIAGKPFASIKASLKEKEAIKILKDIIKKIEN